MPVLRRLLERRSFALTDPAILRLLGGWGPTAAGVQVSEESALRLTAVWSAINLDASTVASLPLKVYRDKPDGLREELKVSLFQDPMNAELDLTWFEGLEFLIQVQRRYGNAYAFKVRNELGDKIVRLIPMLPGDVTPYVDRDDLGQLRKLFRVCGISYPLTPAEILHLPGLMYDGIQGYSPIQVNREAIGGAIAAEQAGARMFDSGLLMGGVLQTDQELDEPQAELTKKRWQDKVQGIARAYEVAVLDRGLKFTPAQIPPKDAQWLEARQFGIAEIARVFRQPPALLFEYMSTGNVEADKLTNLWLRLGFNQLLVRLEKRLSAHLLPRGQLCEFDRYGLTQGTPLEQTQVLTEQIDAELLTVDEGRAILNRPPLPKKPAPPAPPALPAPADDAEPVGDDQEVDVNAA